MATDRAIFKAMQRGALAGTAATSPVSEISYVHSVKFEIIKASADSMAADTTAETYTGDYVYRAARVLGIYFVPTSAGLTAHNTNYATITVSKRDSAAANKVALGTITTTITSSGDLTKGVAEAFVLSTTAGALDLSLGSTLTWEIAKAASGVAVPAGKIVVVMEWA